MSTPPPFLKDPALQRFFAATRAAGGEARVVGGAVRDAQLGVYGGDVDMASSLLPEQTMALANAEGWKAIPTGIAHGTVTVLLPNRTVEVTTLRRDVATDGRHAEVAFTDRFEEDAARRDFTFNALYMDAAGKCYDYFGGVEDLAARRVRFIGDAATRIREDGLRILRYFRFLATHGAAPADAEALAAIARHKEMLAALSGERIAAEMRKLLAALDPAAALGYMQQSGLAPLLTQGEWNIGKLQKLLQLEAQHNVAPMGWTRLLAMLAPETRPAAAGWISERWKLSRAERTLLEVVAAHPPSILSQRAIKECLRHHPRALVEGQTLLAALDGAEEDLTPLLARVRDWPVPTFPLTARDLLARGLAEGKALGDALRGLEQAWVESDYRLSKAELLERLDTHF